MSVDTSPSELETVPKTQLEDVFETPEALMAAQQLSPHKKHELLKQWSTDLEAKLRASDENMTSDGPDKSSELLRRVKIVQRTLEKSL